MQRVAEQPVEAADALLAEVEAAVEVQKMEAVAAAKEQQQILELAQPLTITVCVGRQWGGSSRAGLRVRGERQESELAEWRAVELRALLGMPICVCSLHCLI